MRAARAAFSFAALTPPPPPPLLSVEDRLVWLRLLSRLRLAALFASSLLVLCVVGVAVLLRGFPTFSGDRSGLLDCRAAGAPASRRTLLDGEERLLARLVPRTDWRPSESTEECSSAPHGAGALLVLLLAAMGGSWGDKRGVGVFIIGGLLGSYTMPVSTGDMCLVTLPLAEALLREEETVREEDPAEEDEVGLVAVGLPLPAGGSGGGSGTLGFCRLLFPTSVAADAADAAAADAAGGAPLLLLPPLLAPFASGLPLVEGGFSGE